MNNTGSTVTFKVAGNDLLNYFDKLGSKQTKLTTDLVASAEKEKKSAKEQIDLMEKQIALIEKKRKAASDLEKVLSQSNLDKRLSNVGNRDNTLDALFADTERKKKSGLMGEREYQTTIDRLTNLSNKNSEDSIQKEYKDYVKRVSDEDKEQKTQIKVAKDTLDAVKQTSKDQVQAVRNGDAKLEEVLTGSDAPLERLVDNLTEEGVQEGKDNDSSKAIESLKKLAGVAFATDSIVRLINNVSQLAGTQNGFDIIKPVEEAKGRIIGSIVGGIVGGVGGFFVGGVGAVGGVMAGTAAGGAIGSAIGGGVGEFEQRWALARQDYLGAMNRYQAGTTGFGSSIDVPDMSKYGLSGRNYLDILKGASSTSGSSQGAGKYASDMFLAEKGYGVGQNTSSSLIELQRSAKENNRDLANLIGGVIEEGGNSYFKGGDMTFLNEFLGKFNTLQRELLKTQDRVHSGTTMDVLERFNQVGGQWSTKDPRSMGLISQMQNSLTNPNSDNMNALTFYAIRKANPNMGFFDAQEERQKGFGSPEYLKSIFKLIDQMGGDEQMKMQNTAGAFGLGGNLAAARSLWKKRNALMDGTISMKDIEKETDLGGRAEAATTVLERNTAEISNAMLGSWERALSVMQDGFSNAMKEALSGSVIELKNGRLVIGNVPKNTTQTPTITKDKAYAAPYSGYDTRTQAGRKAALEAGDYGAKF